MGDICGVVLGWGHTELHELGFRSEWQRPVVLAELPWNEGTRADELAAVAERYGAVVSSSQDLPAAARSFGVHVPLELIPVVPLSLLAERGAWEDAALGFDGRELWRRIQQESVLARRQLASYAVDIATAAVSRSASSGGEQLPLLEVALVGLLAAVERWRPPAWPSYGKRGEGQFRSIAGWFIECALADGGRDWGLFAPSTLSYGCVRELAESLPPVPKRLAKCLSRRRPLTQEQVPEILRRLARAESAAGFLVDGVWRCAQRRWWHREPDSNYGLDVNLAKQLYTAGSRAPSIVAELVNSAAREADPHPTLSEIADDPHVHPSLQARALEQLARRGSMSAVLEFLAHPLADVSVNPYAPLAEESVLKARGTDGEEAAREILGSGIVSDAQLAECLAVLGSEAATAARERLEQRPTPAADLLLACLRALPPADTAAIVCQRIRNGEAATNSDWLAALDELDAAESGQAVRDLLATVSRTSDPCARAQKLRVLLDEAEAVPLPRPAQDLIRDTALNDPELHEFGRESSLELVKGWPIGPDPMADPDVRKALNPPPRVSSSALRQNLRMLIATPPNPAQGELLQFLAGGPTTLMQELCLFVLDRKERAEDRLAAAELLIRQDDEAALPALLLAQDELGTQVIDAAVISNAVAVTDLALRWIQRPSRHFRLAAALTFSKIVDQRSAKPLLATAKDPDPRLRRAACWALATQHSPGAISSLVVLLRNDPENRVRRAAAEALGFLGNRQAVPVLSDAMHRDEDLAVRKSAVLGLQYLPGKDAEKVLVSSPRHLRGETREALWIRNCDHSDEEGGDQGHGAGGAEQSGEAARPRPP